MKNILFTLFILFSHSGFAAGNSVLNGGDGIAAEFTAIIKIAVADLANENLSPLDQTILMQVRSHIDQIKVYSKERTFLGDGQEVDAINEPSALKITVSRKRWDSFQNNMQQRLQLVLHEYIGVLGYNDQNYVRSLPLLKAFRSETLVKITSQKDYLLHLENLMNLFEPYHLAMISSLPIVCMDVGQMKSEWQAVLQVYDGKTWYSNFAGAEFSRTHIDQIVKDFEQACLGSDNRTEYLQDLGLWGIAYAAQLYSNIMR